MVRTGLHNLWEFFGYSKRRGRCRQDVCVCFLTGIRHQAPYPLVREHLPALSLVGHCCMQLLVPMMCWLSNLC